MIGDLTAGLDQAILASCLIAFAVVLASVGADLIVRRPLDLTDRLGIAAPPRIVRPGSWAGGSVARALLYRSALAGGLRLELGRAGLAIEPASFLAVQLTAAVLCVAGGWLLEQPVVGLALAALALVGPRQVLRLIGARRAAALVNQLPDTLLTLAASLRAGHSLAQAMDTVTREAVEPTRAEFARVVHEIGLGLSVDAALRNLRARVPGDDLELLVTAVGIQQEIGGNLARILDTLAETLRERRRLHGEIQALTAQQRLSGTVIALLPVALGGAMAILRPDYLAPLLSDEQIICLPAYAILGIAGAMIVVGFLAMRRLTAIDV